MKGSQLKGFSVGFIFVCALLLLSSPSGVFSGETGNDSENPSAPRIEGAQNKVRDDVVLAVGEDATQSTSAGGTRSIKVKLNETEVVEFEIKPNSISREQLLRFAKLLDRRTSQAGSFGDDEEPEEAPKRRKSGDVGKVGNLVGDGGGKKNYPGKLSEVKAEDILPLLPQNLSSFYPYIDRVNNDKCQKHAVYFLQALHNLTKWSVQMFDATTKIPEGILYGSSHNLGNFDECINVAVNVPGENADEPDVLKGQYCLAKVYLSGIENGGDDTEESVVPLHSAWGTLKVPKNRREFRKDVIYWSFCIPSACTNEDIEGFLNVIGDVLSIRGLQLRFEVPPDMCQVKRELVLDEYDVALAFVVAAFILVIAVATAYDLAVVQKSASEHKSFKTNMLLCFSAYTNFVKLSAYTPSTYNLDSIFGIKAITMVLILMGHASAFIFGGPSMNSNFKEEAVLKIENGILLNNPLLVDTFLMIGAFLLCRLLLAELEKRKFVNPLIVYLARIIRLTPAYAVVIAIYCTWFYKLDSGPMWESRIGLERDRCRKSWWANILYINNYISNDNLCMFQSWYLAVDTQFFFLAPGIIIPLYKYPLIGEIILFVATVVSVIIPFVVTFINHLDPVLMMYASEITDLAANPMYRTTYIKTHMRGMSYTIGLFLGYVIHKIQSSGYKVPKKLLWCGWIVGTFSAVLSMFTVSVFYYRPYDPFESASYAALHRVGWCIGIAWVIFACITDNAGKLNRFLSLRLWVPISRLSYCAYLVNGLVELHTIGTLRHTRYLTNIEVAKETVSHIMLTYALALLFSILFEAPILSIESILLKKATNPHPKKQPIGGSTVSVESQSSTETTTSNSLE